MTNYLSNIIPRLRQYSKTLDKNELFVEVPWVIIDEELNQQKYIFKRNGELVISLNGEVTIGTWEYLFAAKSLLIDRVKDKILLNQEFIDPAVMALKKDGVKNELFLLANEKLIPDLNVTHYLKQLYYKKNNITKVEKLTTGAELEVCFYDGNYKGHPVTINAEQAQNGTYKASNSDRKFEIENGILKRIFICVKEHDSNKGKITVEQQRRTRLSIGDFVFQNDSIAPDGSYRLSFWSHILVENGRIV